MKKTYWWRLVSLFVGFIGIVIAYIYRNQLRFGLCENTYLFNNKLSCLDKTSITVGKPLFVLSLSFLLVSFCSLFISDIVFKKWLKFAIAWFILTIILVILAPTSSTSIPGNPTKEDVSIWMSSLFVIISLIQIIILSKKQKQ